MPKFCRNRSSIIRTKIDELFSDDDEEKVSQSASEVTNKRISQEDLEIRRENHKNNNNSHYYTICFDGEVSSDYPSITR